MLFAFFRAEPLDFPAVDPILLARRSPVKRDRRDLAIPTVFSNLYF